MILRPVAPPVEYGITKRLARAGNAAIALLRSLGTSAHVWLPGANGTTVASLPSNNYLLSDGSTGYSTVDGVDGLVKDAMDPVTGINLTQATTANKPLVRRGMYNLLTYSHTLTNAAWTKNGATTAPSATTISFPNTSEAFFNAVTIAAPAGSKWTGAFLLSGTGTTTIFVARYMGGAYEEATLQVTLTATPTLYAVTLTLAAAQTAMLTGVSRLPGNTATTVTCDGGLLVQGLFTAAQILAEGGIPTTTATAASNPTSGKYWWSFDGSNDSLLSGNLGITTACTIVIAGRVNSLAAMQVLMQEGVGGLRLYIFTNGAVGLDAAAGTLVATGAGAITAGVPFVITARLSAGTAVIRNLGVQVATAATAIVGASTTGSRIGTDFAFPTNGALGWVVPLPTALSNADCLTVERLVGSQFPGMATF